MMMMLFLGKHKHSGFQCIAYDSVSMNAPEMLLSCSEQQVSDEFSRTAAAGRYGVLTDDQSRSSSGAPVTRELLLARKSTRGWKGFVGFAGRDDRLRKVRL